MSPNKPGNSWTARAVQEHFSNTIRNRILETWVEKDRFLSVLDRLPQLFCHNDFHRRNLLIRTKLDQSNQLIAVDWNFSGTGPIGSDLGQLIGISLLFFEQEPATAESLLFQCYNAYKGSLIEDGWGSHAELAYLGCLISIALWPGLVLPSFAHWYTEMEPFRATAAAQFGRPEEEMVKGWVAVSDFCINCADQARHIIEKLDW